MIQIHHYINDVFESIYNTIHSLSLIIVSTFEFERYYILLYIHLLFLLNSETSVVTNVKSFNSVNKSVSLYLTLDSISLSCSSGLKEFQISTI